MRFQTDKTLFTHSSELSVLTGQEIARIPAFILKYKIKRCATLEDFVKVCQSVPLRYATGARALPSALIQTKEEIRGLLQILKKKRISNMLEIGTAFGGTLLLFAQTIEPEAKIISLDLPSGILVRVFGGLYEAFRMSIFANFAQEKQRVFFVRDNSHNVSSHSAVKSILNGKKLDFIFIDGDHSYEGVKMDFQMYSPLVRSGGLIAFHDIVENWPGCEVKKFWNEIKHEYKYLEIVKDYHQKWGGIGIVYF